MAFRFWRRNSSCGASCVLWSNACRADVCIIHCFDGRHDITTMAIRDSQAESPFITPDAQFWYPACCSQPPVPLYMLLTPRVQAASDNISAMALEQPFTCSPTANCSILHETCWNGISFPTLLKSTVGLRH
ncbi:hypothetical protein BR93DRAFT_290962 [Coniochaeta sp. PMI_546]|nr:hypothetical protein BR93DRAFT_290962 [Coniochaeta sp. PMI_546]